MAGEGPSGRQTSNSDQTQFRTTGKHGLVLTCCWTYRTPAWGWIRKWSAICSSHFIPTRLAWGTAWDWRQSTVSSSSAAATLLCKACRMKAPPSIFICQGTTKVRERPRRLHFERRSSIHCSSNFGWMLLTLGLIVAEMGLIWILASSIPRLGHLPGDIRIEEENYRI